MSDAAARRPDLGAYRRGVILVLLGSAVSSWIGIGMRMVEAASVWQILVFRSFGLAVFLSLFIAWRYPGRFAAAFRNAGPASVVGGLGLMGAFAGSIVAIERTSVANAMFLLAATPFLAAFLGRLILKERVRTVTWIAMAFAFLGVAVMVTNGVSLGRLSGNVAGLVAALGFATFVISLRWGHLTDMLPLNVLGGVFGVVVGLAMSGWTGVGLDVSLHDALLGLAMGVFQLGLALVLITLGSRTVPAAQLSLFGMTEVVLAPLWVWIFLGEQASLYTLAGGTILLLAIAADALSAMHRERPSP